MNNLAIGSGQLAIGGIEIMFGLLKDGRHVATRDNRCPKVFLSNVALAAIVMFCL